MPVAELGPHRRTPEHGAELPAVLPVVGRQQGEHVTAMVAAQGLDQALNPGRRDDVHPLIGRDPGAEEARHAWSLVMAGDPQRAVDFQDGHLELRSLVVAVTQHDLPRRRTRPGVGVQHRSGRGRDLGHGRVDPLGVARPAAWGFPPRLLSHARLHRVVWARPGRRSGRS
jgi:hypothetical protein